MGVLVHQGSAKKKVRLPTGDLAFVFEDFFSAFDRGRCPQPIPGKGEAVCAAAMVARDVALAVNVPTCLKRRINSVTVQVVEVTPITDRPLTTTDTDTVVPAEWIDRTFVSGSLLRDFRSGKKKPTAFGFTSDDVPAEGTPLPCPVHQFTTKWEKVDRSITSEQARQLCGMTDEDERGFWCLLDRLNGALDMVWRQAGFVRFDGKREFLFVGDPRRKILGDVAGTQDEDRPVPLRDLERGDINHYGKEFLRQYLIECGYKDQLDDARKAGEEDPPYPDIPTSIIRETSRRYRRFAEAVAGVDLGRVLRYHIR